MNKQHLAELVHERGSRPLIYWLISQTQLMKNREVIHNAIKCLGGYIPCQDFAKWLESGEWPKEEENEIEKY